jgi:hypothetical protein
MASKAGAPGLARVCETSFLSLSFLAETPVMRDRSQLALSDEVVLVPVHTRHDARCPGLFRQTCLTAGQQSWYMFCWHSM